MKFIEIKEYLGLPFGVFFILFFGVTVAQTELERQEIIDSYEVEKALNLQKKLDQEQALREQRVQKYMSENSMESVVVEENGKVKQLRDVLDDGTPIYIESHLESFTVLEKGSINMLNNRTAAETIRADELYSDGSLNLDVEGQDMIVGVWEVGGIARQTHEDLVGRMTIIDGTSFFNDSYHATHVTGTVISAGEVLPLNLGRGIAFKGSAHVANSDGDYNEMNSRASTNGLLVSNHSYGYATDGLPLWIFGAYNTDAADVDAICENNPYYLPVMSAGNSRNDGVNPAKNGYDLLTGDKNAKNSLIVAAVNGVSNYTGPSSVVMSSFSSWGPTDDGRIKPDISSMGVNVQSTSNSSDRAYGFSSGTSMASPGIAGLAALLQQHYNDVNGNYMLAATLRGLILHTADEAGSNQGPDYEFGWGLANGEAAANIITNNGTSSNVAERELADGDEFTSTIVAQGGVPLEVSICWTDPAGASVSNEVDNRDAVLVNDLDISLESGGTTYYPWKLDVNNFSSAATRNSTNDVDNFEKIEVDSPTANQSFTLTINHKGSLSGDSQNYTVIVSGGTANNLSVVNFEKNNKQFVIYPNPATDFLNITTKDSAEVIKGVNIFNTSGKRVMTSNKSNNYNIQSLPNGLYIIEIETSKGKYQEKFLKN